MDEILDFEIPAHSTRREWAVYIIVVRPTNDKNSKQRFFYVGKTGDNREGCNPIISRIGNHFSFNKVHSQIRNYLKETANYKYTVFYATYGEYDPKNEERVKGFKDKINELERQLSCYMQEKLKNKEELLNPYKGIGMSKNKKLEREKILTEDEKKKLILLADKAIKQ